MKNRTYSRLFILILIASISLILFSYSHSSSAKSQDKEDCDKCERNKAHSEFILWESLTNNLLTGSR